MDEAVSAQQTNQAVGGRAPRRRPRRGRGGITNASLSFRPASVAPEASTPLTNTAVSEQQATNTGQSSAPSKHGRGRGRGRGGRVAPGRTVNGRQFGGQLTRQDTNASSDSTVPTQLQASASIFVPGQQDSHAHPEPPIKPHPRQQQPQKRRSSKSQAPDIATRTHEDIDHGYYECPICTSEVRRNSKVWSCHDCWTVFHLGCIKKWSTNEGSATAQNGAQDGQILPPRQWRCPGCNLPKDDVPKMYSCWCGKEVDPRPVTGLPPHSCGNTCGKERARLCPHPCELTCHAGPCPPCSHMGPTQVCFCGKHEVTQRCSETDYDGGWSCGEVCGEVMPCGEHTHQAVCHEGLCGACEERVPVRCYCGQFEKDILCDERGEMKESNLRHLSAESEPVLEDWTGSFDCGNVCERELNCGHHRCEKACHSQSIDPGHCPRSPDVVTHCPCGKTALEDLSDQVRTSCTDPIPQCKQRCAKILPCGHEDSQICHTGGCLPCTEMVDIKCRCGRTTSRTMCHQGQEEPPQCARTCKVLLNCGRHHCEERCCAGERKSTERQNTKRKQRPLGATPRMQEELFEPEHICTIPCGRLLKCGSHFCDMLCHRGPCGTCREAIFEEISCHCARTVLQPPLPCGTKPPPCRYPCTRSKACAHQQVPHNCHQDDEACPKCPFLVEKRCMCSKKLLKNQPCWLQDVRCGEVCGKKLRCGLHSCSKSCHRSGECEDADGKACQQPCGKPKKVCGHADADVCHAPFPCKEDRPCQSKIYITCDCQAQKEQTKCGASKASEGNSGKTLPCNEECARLERNRKLALALNIDQSTHVDGGDHIPYSKDTLNLFAESPKWTETQEREFRVFATSPDEKRLRFKPMQSQQRAFVHALAEDFGMDSESMDPEPNRHVMIWKTPRFVSAPNKTLADALRIRQSQRAASTSANVSDNEGQAQKHVRNAASNEPYNGFVIRNPRFGLTVDELRAEILHAGSSLTFDIQFLPSEEVVLKADSRTSAGDLQQMLLSSREPIFAAITSKGYGTPELCATDHSMNVVRRESESAAGWSRVAAKKAAPKIALSSSAVSGGNAYAALGGNKVTFWKKPVKVKAKKEAIVDDWEAAELAEEEKERVTSGASGDEDDVASPISGNELEAPTISAEPSSDQPAEKVEVAVVAEGE